MPSNAALNPICQTFVEQADRWATCNKIVNHRFGSVASGLAKCPMGPIPDIRGTQTSGVRPFAVQALGPRALLTADVISSEDERAVTRA